MTRLFISTCGIIVGQVMVAYLTAQVVSNNPPPGYGTPPGPNAILTWATRPRATFATFFINAMFVFSALHRAKMERKAYVEESIQIADRADRQRNHRLGLLRREEMKHEAIAAVPKPPATPTNCFLQTCVTSFLAEAHVCFIGVSLWARFAAMSSRSDPRNAQSDYKLSLIGAVKKINEMVDYNWPTCTVETNKTILIAMTGLTYSTIFFGTLLILPVWYLSSRRCQTTTSLGGLFKWMVFCWIFATGIFVFSFMLWKAFLEGTSDDEYCIVGTKKLDLIYGICATALAIWRQVV